MIEFQKHTGHCPLDIGIVVVHDDGDDVVVIISARLFEVIARDVLLCEAANIKW